jgi:hypothetical protein
VTNLLSKVGVSFGLGVPLVVGEFVKDPEKRWEYTRLALLLSAAVTETMWPSGSTVRYKTRAIS